MNKVYFAIGLHFHQPVGNFGDILERAYSNCYKPFFETFEKFPDLKINCHFSGNLLDFFEEKHPDYLGKIRKLADAGRVEIMGGGYYEPVFQSIPKRDRLGQIRMMSDYAENRFGYKPCGLWVPERVWSPRLVPDFRQSGIKYVILDDSHIVRAGMDMDNLYGYFVTNYKDDKIAVFPSDKALRYTIPFRFPRETTDYFKGTIRKRMKKAIFGLGSSEMPLFIYGDDAEKFGEWPWTHDWVYKKKWLQSFFEELTRHKGWIETVKFSDCLKIKEPLKEIEIPDGSYEEMMEWSDGSWMNYLTRYPEANQMHKRMMYVSNRLAELREKRPAYRQGRHETGDTGKIEEAERELYKGQCNCAYWHGVFGGIYMYHLRSAVFEHLIKADRTLDEIEHAEPNGWCEVKKINFYDWKSKAIICENRDFFLCVDPANGGSIREFDCKDKSVNLLNTLARRKESYHKKITDRLNNRPSKSLKMHEVIKVMDSRIKDALFYDKHDRLCLIDHFIDGDLKLEDFSSANYEDKGDFSNTPYVARIKERKIILSCEGSVNRKKLIVTKELSLGEGKELTVHYRLQNKTSSSIDTCFGTEFNITLPYADSERYNYANGDKALGRMAESGSAARARHFGINDKSGTLGVDFDFSDKIKKVWYFPVKTVSQSEKSYDLNYQSSCIFPIWHIKLGPAEEINIDITWSIV